MKLFEPQVFQINVYCGTGQVGQVSFHLRHRRVTGDVTFKTEDYELRRRLMRVPTKCKWSELVDSLTHGITNCTAGRYIFRFATTPSREGRGRDRKMIKCMKRCSN